MPRAPDTKSLSDDAKPPSEEQPISLLTPGIYNSSTLPVVREESPIPAESERDSFLPPDSLVDINRDSAFVTDSPIPRQRGFTGEHEHVRDSGVHLRDFSPAEPAREAVSSADDALARMSWPAVDEETETVDLNRSQRFKVDPQDDYRDVKDQSSSQSKHIRDSSQSSQPSHFNEGSSKHHASNIEDHRGILSQRSEKFEPVKREEKATSHPAPRLHDERETRLGDGKIDIHGGVEKHTQQLEANVEDRDLLPSQRHEEAKTDLHRTQTVYKPKKPQGESLVKQRIERIESPDFSRSQKSKEEKHTGLNPSQRPKASSGFHDHSLTAGAALAGATVGFAAARKASWEQRPGSVGSNRSSPNINRLRTPDLKVRAESVESNRSSGTPPLRRSDRKSGDLRSLSQRSKSDLAKEAELAAASTVSTANPTANEGRVRAKDMADVYVSSLNHYLGISPFANSRKGWLRRGAHGLTTVTHSTPQYAPTTKYASPRSRIKTRTISCRESHACRIKSSS